MKHEKYLFLFAGFLSTIAFWGLATPSRSPQVELSATSSVPLWMSPNWSAADFYAFFNDEKTAERNPVLDKVRVFKFYIDTLNTTAKWSYTQSEINKAVSVLNNRGIEIAVEAGGTLEQHCNTPQQVGENSAQTEIQKLRAISNAGGTIKYLVLDGPISRTLAGARSNSCQFNLQRSVDELIDYMRTMRSTYPSIRFVWLVNFPNWTYNGHSGSNVNWSSGMNFADVAAQVLSRTNAAGYPIESVQIDNPYNFMVKSGSRDDVRIRDLYNQVRSYNKGVSVILNSDRNWPTNPTTPFYNSTNTTTRSPARTYGSADKNNATTFFTESLAAYDFIKTKAQISPDAYVVQSWYRTPFWLLPANRYESFSNIVENIFAKINSNGNPDLAVCAGRWGNGTCVATLNNFNCLQSTSQSTQSGCWSYCSSKGNWTASQRASWNLCYYNNQFIHNGGTPPPPTGNTCKACVNPSSGGCSSQPQTTVSSQEACVSYCQSQDANMPSYWAQGWHVCFYNGAVVSGAPSASYSCSACVQPVSGGCTSRPSTTVTSQAACASWCQSRDSNMPYYWSQRWSTCFFNSGAIYGP